MHEVKIRTTGGGELRIMAAYNEASFLGSYRTRQYHQKSSSSAEGFSRITCPVADREPSPFNTAEPSTTLGASFRHLRVRLFPTARSSAGFIVTRIFWSRWTSFLRFFHAHGTPSKRAVHIASYASSPGRFLSQSSTR
jgi:hypothetical protein